MAYRDVALIEECAFFGIDDIIVAGIMIGQAIASAASAVGGAAAAAGSAIGAGASTVGSGTAALGSGLGSMASTAASGLAAIPTSIGGAVGGGVTSGLTGLGVSAPTAGTIGAGTSGLVSGGITGGAIGAGIGGATAAATGQPIGKGMAKGTVIGAATGGTLNGAGAAMGSNGSGASAGLPDIAKPLTPDQILNPLGNGDLGSVGGATGATGSTGQAAAASGASGAAPVAVGPTNAAAGIAPRVPYSVTANTPTEKLFANMKDAGAAMGKAARTVGDSKGFKSTMSGFQMANALAPKPQQQPEQPQSFKVQRRPVQPIQPRSIAPMPQAQPSRIYGMPMAGGAMPPLASSVYGWRS